MCYRVLLRVFWFCYVGGLWGGGSADFFVGFYVAVFRGVACWAVWFTFIDSFGERVV